MASRAIKERPDRGGPDGSAKAGVPMLPLFIAVALAIIGGLVYAYSKLASAGSGSVLALTPEAKAYVQNLKLSGVEMKANESYMKQRITEITGTLTNNGPRAVSSAEVICVFYDQYQQVVLRERLPILPRKSGGLKTGEAKPFRMAFDSIPESWNKQMPQLVIASISF